MEKLASIDAYLVDGCGRCELFKTPQCKVNLWRNVLVELREIVLSTGLKEENKWSQPCYTIDGKNVLILSAFKGYASLAFFKGTLMKDTNKILHAPGKSSQASRLIKFTKVEDVLLKREIILEYINEAITLEKSGAQVEFKKAPEPIPNELLDYFTKSPKLEESFYALTPGRQRGYILHFSQPKKSETRISRIEKMIPQILEGKGIHDDYRKNLK